MTAPALWRSALRRRIRDRFVRACRWRCTALALAAAVLTHTAHAQPTLEAGLWEISVASTANGKSSPTEHSEECLGDDELKDLAAYFAPKLEGVQAQCTTARQPSDTGTVAYRMQCRGADFTVDAVTRVTIEEPRRFTVALEINTRTRHESAVVITNARAERLGACPSK